MTISYIEIISGSLIFSSRFVRRLAVLLAFQLYYKTSKKALPKMVSGNKQNAVDLLDLTHLGELSTDFLVKNTLPALGGKPI